MLVHGASHVVGATNTQQFQRIESDGAVGDSTGFVKVQAIHTSESLHGFQLLHQLARHAKGFVDIFRLFDLKHFFTALLPYSIL